MPVELQQEAETVENIAYLECRPLLLVCPLWLDYRTSNCQPVQERHVGELCQFQGLHALASGQATDNGDHSTQAENHAV